jgi:ABC-type glycerol-3-phosphate transport system permease component
MYEPVELNDFMAAVIAGASVVLFGALYAFGFAMAKLQKERWIYVVAYGLFAALCASVYVLAISLNLNGYWLSVTVAMLLGYLIAPQAIWKLSVGTHEVSD